MTAPAALLVVLVVWAAVGTALGLFMARVVAVRNRQGPPMT